MPLLRPFDGRAGSVPWRGPVAAALAGLAAPASAQAAGGTPQGPWIFASTALVLVAWLAWRAGRKDGSASTDRPAAATPVTPATAAAPATSGAAPAPDRNDADADAGALGALCTELAGQTRVCRPAPDGKGWQMLASHPPLATGTPALDGVPAAVALAARGLRPGASVEIDGWRLHCSGTAGDARLVLRQAAPEPAGGEDPAAFSFTVSHDLRAPVRVVEGFARILKEDYGRQLDRIGNDHVDRILSAAARMNAMIDAMLSLARLSSQPIARQPVNLSQLAAFVIDDLNRAHPDRVVESTVAPGLQAVGDPTLLRQVIENLLSNAWKYSARCAQAKVSFGAAQRDGRLVFEVRDNGAGFDMRAAERLFGLFQRLHSANDFPGTGVGLASVQRIVRRHGGQIWAEAEPGRGACFYFTLPG